MTIEETLLVVVTLVGVYAISVFLLNKKGVLEKFNISFFGPALMWKTNKGKKIIKKLAGNKKFWVTYSTIGVFACLILMILMIFLLLSTLPGVFAVKNTIVSSNPEIIVGLPGLNPIIPLGFGIIAFVIAIIVHEFSHGILSVSQNINVKSLGILYLIIPIGAFVEPDEEALKEAGAKKRMRVFAAGPTANIATAFIFLATATLLFSTMVQPAADGIGVYAVVEDSPAADDLGLRPGMIITSINGSKTRSIQDFMDAMDKTHANQTVEITYVAGEKFFNKNVTLADEYQVKIRLFEKKYGFINETVKEKMSDFKQQGYLGVWATTRFKVDYFFLKNPFLKFPFGFLYYVGLPLLGFINGYSSLSTPFSNFFIVNFLSPSLFWSIYNIFYWIFWFNFMVATFNVLPMIPLDGGYLFSDLVDSFIKKFKRNINKEGREKIVKKITTAVSLIILLIVLAPLIIPYLPRVI